MSRKRILSTIVALALLWTTPLQAAVQIQLDTPTPNVAELDFASMPQSGELRVGDRVILIERVSNGFVATDLDSDQSVVLSDAELSAYRSEVSAALDSSSYIVTQNDIFGSQRSLRVDVDRASQYSFSGTLVAPGLDETISYQATDATPVGTAPGNVAEPVILIITISATVVGALSCAIVALLTNCTQNCADACSQCGGSMVSSSEGMCGMCDCECQVPGLHYDIPPGGSCTAY